MTVYPRADLFDLWNVRDATFWPLWRQELSRTAGGSTQAKDFGTPLWRANFATAPIALMDVGPAEAALISLNGSTGSFLAHDIRRPYPQGYADGVFSDTGTIGALDGGNLFMMSLADLPVGFQLTAGDYLGFSYGARPSRALHMVMAAPPAADALGDTASFEVFPAIRPGALVGAAVTLKKPTCEMILEPGQAPPTTQGMVASAVSFGGIQIF
jgi:hypothetical protein